MARTHNSIACSFNGRNITKTGANGAVMACPAITTLKNAWTSRCPPAGNGSTRRSGSRYCLLVGTAMVWQIFGSDAAAAQGGLQAMPDPSPAAQSPPTQPASAPAQNLLNEVVVTALKRAVNVQNVPASVTAITGSQLAEDGIEDVRDLSKVVPNLEWGEHFGDTLVTLRGVGTNVDSAVVQPSVAMYVDGIYLPRSDMATVRAVDLDRVEVLRGPQGTLYGRNATAGAINFISQSPSESSRGEFVVSGGSRSDYGLSGFVTGSLTKGVDVLLSGGYEHQDGYVTARIVSPTDPSLSTGKQTLNGVDDTFLRAAVRLSPRNDLTVDISTRYDFNTSPNAYLEVLGPSLSPIAPPSGQTLSPDEIVANDRYYQHNETLLTSVAISWNISTHLLFKSLTGVIDHNDDLGADDDGTGTPLEYSPDYKLPSRSISEEIDVLGDYSRFKWIVGGYFFHENAETLLPVVLESAGPLKINLGESSRVQNLALFGDATYSLTSRLRLELGLRYNDENNGYTEFGGIASAAGPIVGPLSANFHTTSNRFLPKVAAQFDITQAMHGYVQWSLGYKAGGANLLGSGTTILPLYRPESISAYEAGIKSQFLDRRLTVNSAVFYYDYNDLQISEDVPPATTLVENADARVYGVEGDVSWKLTQYLSFQVAPTLESARFVNFTSYDSLYGILVNLNNKPIERAPDFTMDANVKYDVQLDGRFLSSVLLQAGLFYSTTSVLRYYNDAPGQDQPSYVIGNLSATLFDSSKRTSFSLFLNNVSNTLYKQEVTAFGLGNLGNYGPPRTFGVRLSRRF